MNEKPLTLSERIQEIIAKKGITQTDLAKKINKSVSSVNAIITGQNKDPRIGTLVPIAQALEVSVDYLVGINDEPSSNLELKAVSKEYGISVEAMENIKFTNSPGTLLTANATRRKIALNRLLEDEGFIHFVDSFCEYLFYYPRVDEDAGAFPLIGHGSEQEYIIDESRGVRINSSLIDDILLSRVKNDLEDIKYNSPEYINNLKTELDVLTNELSDAKESQFISGETAKQITINNYTKKINALEQKLEEIELRKRKKLTYYK